MTNSFQITDKALKVITKKLSQDTTIKYLRVGLKSGGCDGFVSFFQYEADKKDTDVIIQDVVIIDPKSLKLLSGGTLDFHHSLLKSGFKLEIPDTKSCGCGKSFSK